MDIRFLSFSYVVGGAVAYIINARILQKHGFKSSIIFNRDLANNLLIGSLPLGLMFIFSQINFKADAILLSVLRIPLKIGLNNIESVAVYSLPYKIFEVALVLPTFFMNSIYPIFVTKLIHGKNDFRLAFSGTLKYMLGLGLVTSIAMYVSAPLVVNILGGTQFIQSVEVLKILSLGLFIFFLTQPIAYLIVTLDKQRYLPPIYLVSAIFNVTANLIFIPKYSFYASAYITWISEALILAMLIVFAQKSWREHQHAAN